MVLQILVVVLRSQISDVTNVRRRWEYYDQFDGAPGTSDYVKDRSGVNTGDEMHIIIIDHNGGISGTLEKFWKDGKQFQKFQMQKTLRVLIIMQLQSV